ncbi:hypothetical protein CNMCM7691_008622 [Aspergillus felis]|uniref:Uncharacterized protein n=1 Tax=Aspergillus felis TaxID=1287682 RepID=A0A8H6QPH4_9EURO|nr:hypothetical protein CNMCM7691_008622 [Aspergillus felis]
MVKYSSVTTGAHALISLAALGAQSVTAYVPLWQPQYENEAAATARVIQLKHAGDATGHFLATFEHWYYKPNDTKVSNGTASNFIIRESSDQGQSWNTLAKVSAPDGLPNFFYYQPFLFEFPQQLGKYPAGTLLLVGNLHDGNRTYFYSWRSADHGKKWDNIGVWQRGHTITEKPGNPSAGIWEPFLYLDSQDNIVAVFSDERDYEKHSQKLVHLVSRDGGDNWSGDRDGRPFPDVVSSDQAMRPGMATVAKMDNGEYFMSYEWCDLRYYKSTGTCPVHAKTSKDGVTWNPSDNGTYVSTPDGVLGCGSPYSIWDPVGKQLIVSSSRKRWFDASATKNATDPTLENHHVVHINKNYGKDDWYWASAPWYVPLADNCNSNYSPDLLSLPNGEILYSTDTPAKGKQCEEGTLAAPIATLPYNSKFSSAGAASWINFDQKWSISKDQYVFPAVTKPTIVLTGSSGWTDYEISADIIITSKSGVAGVVVRASNSPNDSHLSRYTAAIDSNKGDLTLYQVGDTATTTLKSQPVSGGVKANQQYQLSLSVKSTSLVATLTGSGGAKTTLNVTNNGLLRGATGLYGGYGSGGFSNVQIKDLS